MLGGTPAAPAQVTVTESKHSALNPLVVCPSSHKVIVGAVATTVPLNVAHVLLV